VASDPEATFSRSHGVVWSRPMEENWLPILIALGFLVVFPLFWMFISLVISLWGWHWLARQYPEPGPFPGAYQTWRSGMVGLSRYNHVLHVGANAEGLSLRVMFLFRVGHPPLFIPWEEVISASRGGIFFRHVELRFKRAKVSVRLQGGDLEDSLRAASGGRFPLAPEKAIA
jgi:hypothetical protein